MRYPHGFIFLFAMMLLLGGTATWAGDAGFYRQKAAHAFADQRYLQAASYAAKALAENRSDKKMHILLVRASDKMGAGNKRVSALYQQALKAYPRSPELLAYAAGFYRRTGNQNYARRLAAQFEQICRFNCLQYRNYIEDTR